MAKKLSTINARSRKKGKPSSSSRMKISKRAPRLENVGARFSFKEKYREKLATSRDEGTKRETNPGQSIRFRARNSRSDRRKPREASSRKRSAVKRVSRKRRNPKKGNPLRSAARVPILDGLHLKGRDLDFKRVVEVIDEIKTITTKANWPNNVRLGIAGVDLEIKKRIINFLRKKGIKPGSKFPYYEALLQKLLQVFKAEGPGIFYTKLKLSKATGNDEYVDTWISTPRKRVETEKDLEDNLFSLLTTLEGASEDSRYGFSESGYGFAGIEFEWSEDRANTA